MVVSSLVVMGKTRENQGEGFSLVYGFGDFRAWSLGSLHPRLKVRCITIECKDMSSKAVLHGRQAGGREKGESLQSLLYFLPQLPSSLRYESISGLTSDDVGTS